MTKLMQPTAKLGAITYLM